MNIKVKKIALMDMLMAIFIVVSFFDQARESLPLNIFVIKMFAIVRDGLLIVLGFCYIKKLKVIKNKIGILTVICFTCGVIFSFFIGTLNGNNIGESLKTVWLYSKSIIVFFIFSKYISNDNFYFISRFIVYWGIVLALFNFTISFFYSSTLRMLFSGGLRLTVGNSSIISYIYIALFLICDQIQINQNIAVNIVCKVIYVLAILTTGTATAYVVLLCYFGIKFILSDTSKKIKYIVFLLVLGMMLSSFWKSSVVESKNEYVAYTISKIKQVTEILNGTQLNNIGTLTARELQKRIVRENMRTIDYIVGLGINGHRIYVSHLENFYYVLIYDFGFFTFACYICVLVAMSIRGYLEKKVFTLGIVCSLAFYCYTLDFFRPYLTSFGVGLLFAISRRYDDIICNNNLLTKKVEK